MQRSEILDLLRNADFETLQAEAAKIVTSTKGQKVNLRGLIEISNICRRNCLYCGLRKENLTLQRYCLTKAEILEAARKAKKAGVDTFVLQSGENAMQPSHLAEIIAELVAELGLVITLSVGEASYNDYKLWKEAGASRFLLKHETADAKLYAKLHPSYSLSQRLHCLEMLADLGYEVGSGFIIGLPGQSLETIADDLYLVQSLKVAMCGVGPFVPQHATPLAKQPKGSPELTLRVVALLRILLPNANLPATTALATLDPVNGQKSGLLAGANVLMPSFTPEQYRANYCIYDNKKRVDIDIARQAVKEAGKFCN